MVAEGTFALLTRTHTILSNNRSHCENVMLSRRKRTPIESLSNFHRSKLQLPFARTSPSTFLFLLSSQCQRADHSAVAGINRHREHRSHNSFGEHDLVAGCPADCPTSVRNRRQWEKLVLNVVNVAAVLVDISIHVNHRISVADLKDFSLFSVTCFLARRRLAPRPEAMTGL